MGQEDSSRSPVRTQSDGIYETELKLKTTSMVAPDAYLRGGPGFGVRAGVDL